NGQLICPAGGIGEIAITPRGEALEIRFGQETVLYQRLVAAAGDADAFAEAALGRYRGEDADTLATIERDGEGLTLSLSDGYGRVDAPLIALSPTVGFSKPKGAMAVFRTTLTLNAQGGRAAGFWVNTPRTRHLAFRRV
ncbi:MAG TPA: hypothetical protein VKS60_06005, partial [Stellaceae bacterium]|nr:hypothetical protein [Stellaceae bacterium]